MPLRKKLSRLLVPAQESARSSRTSFDRPTQICDEHVVYVAKYTSVAGELKRLWDQEILERLRNSLQDATNGDGCYPELLMAGTQREVIMPTVVLTSLEREAKQVLEQHLHHHSMKWFSELLSQHGAAVWIHLRTNQNVRHLHCPGSEPLTQQEHMERLSKQKKRTASDFLEDHPKTAELGKIVGLGLAIKGVQKIRDRRR